MIVFICECLGAGWLSCVGCLVCFFVRAGVFLCAYACVCFYYVVVFLSQATTGKLKEEIKVLEAKLQQTIQDNAKALSVPLSEKILAMNEVDTVQNCALDIVLCSSKNFWEADI